MLNTQSASIIKDFIDFAQELTWSFSYIKDAMTPNTKPIKAITINIA